MQIVCELISFKIIEFINLVLSGTGFDEESAILGAGREFALMKTANGKVNYYFRIKNEQSVL